MNWAATGAHLRFRRPGVEPASVTRIGGDSDQINPATRQPFCLHRNVRNQFPGLLRTHL